MFGFKKQTLYLNAQSGERQQPVVLVVVVLGNTRSRTEAAAAAAAAAESEAIAATVEGCDMTHLRNTKRLYNVTVFYWKN